MEGGPFTQTLMQEVARGNIDPETGMALEPVGNKLLFMQMAAVGVSVFSQFIFVKWNQYKQKAKQENQQQAQQQQFDDNMATLAIQGTPSPADTPQQQYDWEALDVRGRSFPQLLADCRMLRQQLREQKQECEHKIETEQQKHYNYIQRTQIGMDTKEQKRSEELVDLQRFVTIKQNIIDEQTMLLQAMDESIVTKRPEIPN